MQNLNREKAKSILKMARITSVPVDVKKIASVLGFTVVEYPFPDKLSGQVTVIEGQKIIGVNEKHPKTRQRYTIAHELGHFLNGHQHYQMSYIDDHTRFYDPHFHQEKEADLFAGELLMPKDLLEKDVAELGVDVTKLSEKYVVSEQSMIIRLTSTGLMNKFGV